MTVNEKELYNEKLGELKDIQNEIKVLKAKEQDLKRK